MVNGRLAAFAHLRGERAKASGAGNGEAKSVFGVQAVQVLEFAVAAVRAPAKADGEGSRLIGK